MKLVILDRDGTLNADVPDGFLLQAEQWQPLSGSLEAVARLNQGGYTVVMATNIPGLGRGLIDMATLHDTHARMHKALAAVGGRIDAVFFCPHLPEEGCDCRKPRAGLFLQIGERYGVPLSQVDAVGNSLSDIQAARAAGCRAHLVLTGRGRPAQVDPLPPEFGEGVAVHADLAAFACALLARPSIP